MRKLNKNNNIKSLFIILNVFVSKGIYNGNNQINSSTIISIYLYKISDDISCVLIFRSVTDLTAIN